MSVEKQKRLVDLLVNKTTAGKLDWKPTVNDGEFQVSFSTNSLLIREVWRGEARDIAITLLNEDGEVAEQFSDTDLDEFDNVWFIKMEGLLNAARRWALGADKILNSILSDLEDI